MLVKNYTILQIICLLCLSLFYKTLCAYEIETHNELSKKSAACSVLTANGFMEALGLLPIENKEMKFHRELKEKVDDYTIHKLIGWGAMFEDEAPGLRPLNHFFNPLRNQPLTVLIELGKTSPDWALEDGSPQPEIQGQDNSFFDASDLIKQALISGSEAQRKEQWGEFFQTLGMVVHHIQDMSQPQHVRNDQHCDGDVKDVACYGKHNPSWYEKYTNIHRERLIGNVECDTYPELDLTQFTQARDFWLNNNGQGIGMAEFTNRNFVSKGTNFRRQFPAGKILSDKNYPQPALQNGGTGTDIYKMDIRHPDLMGPDFALAGEIWFLGTQVSDNYLPERSKLNKYTSSYSLWDDKLKYYNINNVLGFQEKRLNLNHLNFEKAYDFLFPRAVSYSAGLINYFFRGRMAVNNVQYLAGDQISLTVKNITAEKNPGNAPFSFTEGDFILSYDDSDGNRYSLTPHAINTEFNNDDEISLSFTLPAAMNAIDTSRPFTLIFDGQIGSPDLDQNEWERGIAAKTFYTSPLMAFNIEGTAGGALVPNVVNTYRSYDQGLSWETAGPFYVMVNDDTVDDPDNKVKIRNIVMTAPVYFYTSLIRTMTRLAGAGEYIIPLHLLMLD